MLSEVINNENTCNYRRPCKKSQRQGAQGTRREAYFCVRRNNEGHSATQRNAAYGLFARPS